MKPQLCFFLEKPSLVHFTDLLTICFGVFEKKIAFTYFLAHLWCAYAMVLCLSYGSCAMQ